MQLIDSKILAKANVWLNENYDDQTKLKVKELIEKNPEELTDAFYKDLEFGTGGLRGVMGVGTNRMNKYTVGMATQGLANYLKKCFPSEIRIKVAIAFDSRNNSSFFANVAADVLSANNCEVFLFEALRPTPELSFAIRYLKCHSGIVITASHNPKEYNGYKCYWNDGAQMIPPHDVNVIDEVKKIKKIDEVKFKGDKKNIQVIGGHVDDAYLDKVKSLSLNPAAINKHKDLKIVYTPLHGTGITLVPLAMQAFGFENVSIVEEQAMADGNFPTIKSPNPEEPAALELAIQKAKKINADLVLATDPDADRVGVAVKDDNGNFILLNGNQTASLLVYYIINAYKENKKLTSAEYIIKTIVTTELIKEIADSFKVKCFNVLTGFKYIAAVIKELEGKKNFICGGEESYGFLIGDFVRDKDAVSACCMIAEMTAWAREQSKSLFELLVDIYKKYGFYKEYLLNITKKGRSGAEEIDAMMSHFRSSPPKSINNSMVVKIKDYLSLQEIDHTTGKHHRIDLPKSNVLQFILADGSIISMRPSGTEPKIKFYFGVKTPLKDAKDYKKTNEALDNKIQQITTCLKLS